MKCKYISHLQEEMYSDGKKLIIKYKQATERNNIHYQNVIYEVNISKSSSLSIENVQYDYNNTYRLCN